VGCSSSKPKPDPDKPNEDPGKTATPPGLTPPPLTAKEITDDKLLAAWKAGRVALLADMVVQAKTFERGFESVLPFLAEKDVRDDLTRAFVAIASSGEPVARERALEGIREMGRYNMISDGLRPQVIEAVKARVAKEKSPDPGAAAVECLGTLARGDSGPIVLKTLERAIDVADAPQVVRACADVIADLAYRPAAAVVMRAADRTTDHYAQRALLRAMGRVGGQDAAERLRAALTSTDPAEREAAATALGDAGGSLAAEALRDTVLRQEEQPRVRRAAVVALEKLGGDIGIRALEACLRSVRDRSDEGSRVLARDLQAAIDRLRHKG
jgi:HEAT repeat protein